MLDIGRLSANDHAELEGLTGHAITDVADLPPLDRMRVMAAAWWLQQRKDDPDFTFEEALDTPIGDYVPGVADEVDPTS